MRRRYRPRAKTQSAVVAVAASIMTCSTSSPAVAYVASPHGYKSYHPARLSDSLNTLQGIRVRLDGPTSSTYGTKRQRSRGTLRTVTRGAVLPADVMDDERKMFFPKPPPFKSRLLGSFEKMLTQTKDGMAPAEEGERTLLTPHVWAAVIDGDLSRKALKRGVEAVLARHPMLRACIRTPPGPKEPLLNILGEEREDGDPLYFCESDYESLGELAERVLVQRETTVVGQDSFDKEWQQRLEGNLDNARLPVSTGPNWRLETIRLAGSRRTALVCTMNHALEDQRSSNLMLQGILEVAAGADISSGGIEVSSNDLPPSMEAAIVQGPHFRANTLGYMWEQAIAGLAHPKILPDGLPSVEDRDQAGDDASYGVANRRSGCEFLSLSESDVAAMLHACRDRGQTLSGALSAACLMSCSDLVEAGKGRGENLYKFLMAVDLRRLGSGQYSGGNDWTGGTVACAGGAIDYVVRVPVGSGTKLAGRAGGSAQEEAHETFWKLAQRCRSATRDMVAKETLREAVAVFDWAMENMSIWASLEIESRNPKTLGRAYTCGVSNMGRYPFETRMGGLSLGAVHYGTSQSACGSLFQLSCGTVDGKLFMTLQFAEPIVSREMAKAYLKGIADNLRAGCGVSPPSA